MYRQIVTISREYGSGGSQIGKQVAQELGIEFYDRQLIELAAQKSGFSLSYVEETEENKVSSLLYSLALSGMYARNTYAPEYMNPTDQVYILQSRIIREIAEKGPCVIVGRSADYILGDRRDSLHVFIHADAATRQQRAIAEYGLAREGIEKEVQKKDKARANHYRHYTGRIWGMAQNYHLALDSGNLGIDACVRQIVSLVKEN